MPKFIVKCNYEKLLSADLNVELPEDEDELAEFMEEFESENDINWSEVKVVFEYSGYESQGITAPQKIAVKVAANQGESDVIFKTIEDGALKSIDPVHK